ncbi:MAG: hypothetical protein GY930_17495 [bacterium]|nr:hypothetical protein [bacterium]
MIQKNGFHAILERTRQLRLGFPLVCAAIFWPLSVFGSGFPTVDARFDDHGQASLVTQALLQSRKSDEARKALAPLLASVAAKSPTSICEPLIQGHFELRVGEGQVVLRDLRIDERAALMAALGSAKPESLRTYLDTHAQPGIPAGTRIAILGILQSHGVATDMSSLSEWVCGHGWEGRIRRDLRKAFGQAVAGILDRDPSAFLTINRMDRDLPVALKPALISALGGVGSRSSLTTLADMLGNDSRLESLILRELAVLGSKIPHPLNDDVLTKVAKALHSPSRTVRQQGIEACRLMETTQAVPTLIKLLGSEDAAESEQALKALESITGQRLSPIEREWTEWYAKATTWWETEAQDLMLLVRTGTPAEVNQALVDLSRLRYFRHRLALPMAIALTNEEESIVGVACATLGHVASPLAVKPLLKLLAGSNTERIQQAALQALLNITGQNHGLDPEAWRQAGW